MKIKASDIAMIPIQRPLVNPEKIMGPKIGSGLSKI
jgi:hypothetical protein